MAGLVIEVRFQDLAIHGHGIDAQGGIGFAQRFVMPAQIGQKVPIPDVREGEIRVDRERLAELLFSVRPHPLVPERNPAQDSMRVGQLRIESDGVERCLSRFREGIAWWNVARNGQAVVAVGQTGVSTGVPWISPNGVVKISNRLQDRLALQLEGEDAAPEIRLVGVRIVRIPLRQPAAVVSGQLESQSIRDLPGD